MQVTNFIQQLKTKIRVAKAAKVDIRDFLQEKSSREDQIISVVNQIPGIGIATNPHFILTKTPDEEEISYIYMDFEGVEWTDTDDDEE